jgi:NADH dehydrogenase FAD-containing subunit
MTTMKKTKILFAGAGHAHLFSLVRLEAFLRHHGEVTVVSPTPLWYSGMGPGLLSGRYTPREASLDVRTLVEERGGRFLEDTVARLLPEKRMAVTTKGEEISYDLLSLNIGSEISSPLLESGSERVFPVKPVESFLKLRQALLALPPREELHLAVAGGGPSGCETAANIYEFCKAHQRKVRITLSTGPRGILPGLPPKAARIMARELAKRRITLREQPIRGYQEGTLLYEGGSSEKADFLMVATGVRPPKLLRESGLSTDKVGALVLGRHLQSPDNPEIFGGGDCIAFQPLPLRRAGVYALRQGPILFANLLARLTDKPLEPFIPQREFLMILNLGSTGLLLRKPLVLSGSFALGLKEWIDRRFIRSFQKDLDRNQH